MRESRGRATVTITITFGLTRDGIMGMKRDFRQRLVLDMHSIDRMYVVDFRSYGVGGFGREKQVVTRYLLLKLSRY